MTENGIGICEWETWTRLSDDQTDLRSIPDTCLNNFEVLGCKEWGRLR